ncbi:MAG: chromate efflux transporter [Verrucomicrobiae bacterium]|nr:chromate efflux transporter [Verrucomicrobiae bacterium]NNJ44281.1 chromate efflux transporter [Akkermansiaceae bacterium]
MHRGWLECFWISLKLGLTSFGGPVAHLGYFREAYVVREKWLNEDRYAELVALTQFLPGPGSSQLGAAIGYERAGWLGGLGAWLGFTLPSALLMIALAVGMDGVEQWLGTGWLHGLKLAAIAVVVVALWGMRKSLCPRWPEMLFAAVAWVVLSIAAQAWVQPVMILIGGLAGILIFREHEGPEEAPRGGMIPLRGILAAVVVMLALLWVPWMMDGNRDVQGTGGLLRAGALVFGGGHVVLPLLESSTVGTGMVDKETFLAGYGAAQAVPGPLFTFGGFLGASIPLFGHTWLGPWLGGAVGITAVFLPGMVLLAGGLPLWNRLKHFAWARAGVRGANATVVGVLGAALWGMLSNGGLHGLMDAVGIVMLVLAIYWRWLPVWAIVLVAAVVAGIVGG